MQPMIRAQAHHASHNVTGSKMSIISPWYQLGYVIRHLYTDLDAYQFYRVAPEGMMLVTTGLNLKDYSLAAVEQELPTFWERIDLLARKKVDRIALSGVPVAAGLGRTKMLEILAEAHDRAGLPCGPDPGWVRVLAPL